MIIIIDVMEKSSINMTDRILIEKHEEFLNVSFLYHYNDSYKEKERSTIFFPLVEAKSLELKHKNLYIKGSTSEKDIRESYEFFLSLSTSTKKKESYEEYKKDYILMNKEMEDQTKGKYEYTLTYEDYKISITYKLQKKSFSIAFFTKGMKIHKFYSSNTAIFINGVELKRDNSFYDNMANEIMNYWKTDDEIIKEAKRTRGENNER